MITRVNSQSFSNQATFTSNTISTTLGFSASNNNLLVAVFAMLSGGAIQSIAQTNVTWAKATSQVLATSAGVELWYGVVSGGTAGTTLSVTSNLTLWNFGLIIAEYSGLSSNPLDKIASNSAAATTTVDSGTTATTSQNNELWVAGFYANVGTATIGSPSNGFTQVSQISADDTITNPMAFEENIVSSTGTANTSASVTASGAVGGVIATFTSSNITPTLTLMGVGS